MRLTIAGAILVLCNIHSARGADPELDYQQKRLEIYQQEKQQYLDGVETMYYAVGCKVVTEVGASALVSEARQSLMATLLQQRIQGDPALATQEKAAEDSGKKMAQPAGACVLWKKNPRAEEFLRRLVETTD